MLTSMLVIWIGAKLNKIQKTNKLNEERETV